MFKATTSVTHTGGVEEEGEYEATDSALLLSTGQLRKQSNVIIHNSSFPIQCFCFTRTLSVAPFSPRHPLCLTLLSVMYQGKAMAQPLPGTEHLDDCISLRKTPSGRKYKIDYLSVICHHHE